jgi:hypothetical protein
MADRDVDVELRRRLGARLVELDARILDRKRALTAALPRARALWLELEELLGEREALRERGAFALGREQGRAEAVVQALGPSFPRDPPEALRIVRQLARALAELADAALRGAPTEPPEPPPDGDPS